MPQVSSITTTFRAWLGTWSRKRQLMFNFLFVFSVFFDVAIKMKGENHDTRNKEQVVRMD